MAVAEVGAEPGNLRRGRERADDLEHLREDRMMLSLPLYHARTSNASAGLTSRRTATHF